VVAGELSFRDGGASDLETTFALSVQAMHDTATRQGIFPPGQTPTDAAIRADWVRHRPFLEHIAAQPDGRYVIAEGADGPVGYARVVRYTGMEELTELMVMPEYQQRGIGRRLLELTWPSSPTPTLGRVVVAAGAASDLSLYLAFGVMPVAGHWHLRQRTEAYLERRAQETESTDPAVHLLKPDRAVREWLRLEPPVLGHERTALHEFFSRDRNCLAALDPQSGDVTALCWVSGDGVIGPAVAAEPGGLAPVMVAALDRVAKVQEPSHLSVFATTLSWLLLRRLRTLGFSVYWPSWIMCSVPLPGLDRYAPTRPPHLL
jgi:GNAT superfamily N-acetyltransferase